MNLARHLRLAAMGLLCSATAWAVPTQKIQVAVLQNGFSIEHHSREQLGDTTRLYTSGDRRNYVDVLSADVSTWEEREMVIPELPKEAAPVPAQTTGVMALVHSAGARHGIDPDFLHSVVRAESSGNQQAVSRKGARGLMQLMPRTAAELKVDPNDPAQNIEGGTKYLRELLAKYGNDPVKALAAYNAGPGNVDRYKGVPPYRETRTYVSRIIRDFNRKKAAQKRAAKNTRSRPVARSSQAQGATH